MAGVTINAVIRITTYVTNRMMEENPMEQIRISDSEWKIMKTLWNADGRVMSLGEIITALGEESKWSYTTVRTLIVRLMEKGAINADKTTGVYRYSAKLDEKECIGEEVRSFISRVFDDSPSRLVASLVHDGKMNEKEKSEILKLLSEIK